MSPERFYDLLFYGDLGSSGSGEKVLFICVMAFVVGQIVGWIYMWTHKALSYSQTFVASLVVMPVIVALMMSLISGSMYVAFGLLAVFAVVRFRNVLKDTRDTVFVLWAIVEGMAVGTQKFTSALIGLFVVSFLLLYLRVTSFGRRSQFDVVLDFFFEGEHSKGVVQLKPVLRRHGLKVQLVSSRPSPGEGTDFSYRLLLRDPGRSSDLQTELESFPGVDRVAVFMRDDESEV